MKMMLLRASLALCACPGITPVFGYISTPSDPDASPVTVNVYNHIVTRSTDTSNKMIMGQHLGGISEIQDTTAPYEFDIDNHLIDGKLPGMVGTRYDAPNKELPGNPYTLTSAFCTQLNDELINIWNAHQPIIHITGIPPNPWNWASGRDPYLSTNDIDDLWLSAPSSAAKTSFWSSIDIIAGALQELEDAGIPVVFRPFAEFNQTNKYYFANQTGADFITLWQDVYDYYVGVKGLHNLLFCWEVWALNRNVNSSNIGPWYPGDSYVDIVAGAYYFAPETDIDYLDDVTGEFSFANSDPEDQIVYDYLIARNRPFGAAQFGLNQGHGPTPGDHNFTLKFMDYSPEMAFAYYWKGYQEVQLQANAVAFVNEIQVATANDLPNFSTTSATVTLSNLNQTYNGSPRAVTVTTVPAGLSCSVTYNGSSTVPTNAGSYAVVATITDPGYTGSGSGTLVVAKATATVTLGSLSQTYNGSPRVATATTSPAGLSVSFTYDGSGTAPTNAGSYAVVGTINDINYTGSASGTLVVAKAAATVTLGSLSQTYNGSPRVVTATTSPAGLSVSFTYNGSSTAPTNAGSYAVVGTINDTNYTGSASGTLVVAKATATVTLGNLTHTYDGTPKSATATTSPAGLSVSFTYNGSGTAPSAVGSYAVVGTINDANYTGSASGTMVINAAAPTTVTFLSVSAHDGYVFESNETSNVGGTANTTGANASALRTGDTASDQQYKAFVSFDTSSIPDGATIISVTLRLKRGALTGQNPFATHGACRVDIVGGSGFGGAVALATGDFQAAAGATQVATMSDPVSNGSWSTGAVNAAGLSVVNKTGHSQLRVYFATDDNDDSGNDYVGWYSGEAASGNKPELVVTYQ